VASFCSKCGTGLAPGVQFCPACGAPAAATPPAASFPAQQPAPPPFQPVAVPVQPMAPAPARSGGSSALKIVLIIVAVFVGLGVLGAGAFGFFVWRVAHSFHVSGSGDNATVSTPWGQINPDSSESFNSSDLGTDIYPGAQPGKGGMRMSLPSGKMVSAVYLTSDSKDQVLAFYKSKLTGNVSTFDTANGSVITCNKGQQDSVVVTVTSNSSEFDGKTQIHIVHTTAIKAS
jgi:hypothetical protein